MFVLGAILSMAALGAPAVAAPDACLSVRFEGKLEAHTSRSVAIRLPSDVTGPFSSADSDDYWWNSGSGTVIVQFGKEMWGGVPIGTIGSGKYVFRAYKWTDYSGVDRVLGQLIDSEDVRGLIVSVPTPGYDCAYVSEAASIIGSVVPINDPNKIRFVNPDLGGERKTVTVINELNDRRVVGIGDEVTSNGGILSDIRRSEAVVKIFDWDKGRFVKKTYRYSGD